jgi:hypothetical protein
MRDERTPTPTEEDARIDSAVLGLLLDPEEQRPWSDHELAREIGDDVATTDSLARLSGAGLIHRHDGFAWATRAALS